MKKTNFALISALYSNRDHGLYSDIYFPIIKYAITRIFSEHKDSHPYCSADDIYNFIMVKISNFVAQYRYVSLKDQKLVLVSFWARNPKSDLRVVEILALI